MVENLSSLNPQMREAALGKNGALNEAHSKLLGKESVEGSDLKEIDSLSPKELKERMHQAIESEDIESKKIKETPIKEELLSPYTESINRYIRTNGELDVYKKENLNESTVNGKPSLINNDIDWAEKDAFGNSNVERVHKERSPIGPDGKPFDLHHIGQKADSPLAELPRTTHTENYGDLHIVKDSEINRAQFKTERINHWKERVKNL